jgi:hypothetical protein
VKTRYALFVGYLCGLGCGVVILSNLSAQSKKRVFKKFTYRGIDLENLLDLSTEQFAQLVHARARRRFTKRGLKKKHTNLLRKLRTAVSQQKKK